MSQVVNIAFLCFVSNDNVQDNIDAVATLCAQAAEQGAQWVFLPEMWTHQTECLETFKKLSIQADQDVMRAIKELAQKHGLHIFAGSWTEKSDHPEKFYNTQYVISPDAKVVGKYRKIHLFKMDDGSDNPYRETKKFIPGTEAVCADVGSWKAMLSTCFDVRFPNLYTSMSDQAPMDVITVPSAFIHATGRDHWEVLLKARAIENQCYVIASNRIGVHPDPRIKSYFGHSMVIDPWGKTILDTQDQEGVFVASISKKRIQEVRTLLPVFKVKQYKKNIY